MTKKVKEAEKNKTTEKIPFRNMISNLLTRKEFINRKFSVDVFDRPSQSKNYRSLVADEMLKEVKESGIIGAYETSLTHRKVINSMVNASIAHSALESAAMSNSIKSTLKHCGNTINLSELLRDAKADYLLLNNIIGQMPFDTELRTASFNVGIFNEVLCDEVDRLNEALKRSIEPASVIFTEGVNMPAQTLIGLQEKETPLIDSDYDTVIFPYRAKNTPAEAIDNLSGATKQVEDNQLKIALKKMLKEATRNLNKAKTQVAGSRSNHLPRSLATAESHVLMYLKEIKNLEILTNIKHF